VPGCWTGPNHKVAIPPYCSGQFRRTSPPPSWWHSAARRNPTVLLRSTPTLDFYFYYNRHTGESQSHRTAQGALARSKRLYGVRIICFSFVSNHFHLLLEVDNARQLSRFMGYFNSKLAKEVGRLTGWRGKIFGRRYQAILVTPEEAAQIERMVYVLSHGAKDSWTARGSGRASMPSGHCSARKSSRATGSTVRRNTPPVIAERTLSR
jgi:REP element-mobilizing transposase RayT